VFVHAASHHTHIQVIDATPRYLSHPSVIKRIALAYGSNYPHTFLLILRDPIDRAFSQYMMGISRDPDKNTLSFDDDIDAELRLAYTIDSTLHNVTAFERYEALYAQLDLIRFFLSFFLSLFLFFFLSFFILLLLFLLLPDAVQQAGAGHV
jgi:hypothetical protein